ncbi:MULTISPECIES: DEAD/DEAH box helicase [unclassified Deinococcus]|uniref:DEAD/DEAH box helicase n=1 Tax=unclassified Deinococcus TaxID=2623546 RepID=UPI001C3116CC|nr:MULTISPECIES: DEAD/DEAH box helicase family protein [unclassified Deinococcus]MDK2014424.1 DEAD/DEAH box helicase family protein [Deinococcus sp. 43]
MRYTLHDYQEDAVKNVLRNLEMARAAYKQFGSLSQFSLTALTGAGKTVMAAGVLEALFFGSDEYNFVADPGAVVLWFSDDPSLNHQSRIRIQAAASELDNRLIVVETDFADTKFKPGHIYFLNTQKLSKNSRLVKGELVQEDGKLLQVRPDLLQSSIYDVIRNTIEDKELTLYMVLDEAHRGMSTSNSEKERTTIVQRLINGQNGVPPIPIVWGISATVDRFTNAMKNVTNRTAQPAVLVDSEKVQESGLLKDDIVLGIPEAGGSGTYDFTLLRRAVDKIKASDDAWKQYTDEQGLEPVAPLLVVQMADNATNEDIHNVLSAIYEQWALPNGAVAHVFGEHRSLQIGREEIPYIPPEQVQDTKRIRVLLAKSAISTGWDCPRAEVLMSFRPAKDETHITQLLGRMMRTPLARRIPKNQLLNSVDCLLPFFDRQTAKSVAERLTKGTGGAGGDEGNPNQRVLIDPVDLSQNAEIDPQVVTFFEQLPTAVLPSKDVKPIKRLTALATALSKDGLLEGAVEKAFSQLHDFLDAKVSGEYQTRMERGREEVQTMKGEELRARMGGNGLAPTRSFSEEADPRAIEASFQASGRLLSNQLAKSYAAHIAGPDAEEDEFLESHIDVAAIGQIPDLVRDVEFEADRIAHQWLQDTRAQRSALSDAQQEIYFRLEKQSTRPWYNTMLLPVAAQTNSRERRADDSEVDLPTYRLHLLSTEAGVYPAELNTWEGKVLEQEIQGQGFVGWYRNPSRGLRDSLAVPYKDPTTGNWKPMRPDFLFFSRDDDGQFVADLIDPHGYHLIDALPKLRGLADFTEAVGQSFRRIEAVAEVDNVLWKLDLKDEAVRAAIREATDTKALYLSQIATSY